MNQNLDKQLTFEVCLDKGVVHLVFDTKHPDVLIPERARKHIDPEGALVLRYSKNYQNANIKSTEQGVSANLSFSGQQERTFVPWEAVRAIQQDKKLFEYPRYRGSEIVKSAPYFPYEEFGVEDAKSTLWLAQVAEG